MPSPFSLQQPFHPNGQLHALGEETSYWFIVREGRIALHTGTDTLSIPRLRHPPFADSAVLYSRHIGLYGKTRCMAAELAEDTPLPGDLALVSLREAFKHISSDLWTIAGRAIQLLQWNRHHRFCGRCGEPMLEEENEPVKRCPRCEFLSYPRLSPAVIMSITRDKTILLGRARHFPKGMYSPLAGFVEPGENLEDAVAREVKEEVNIDISGIRYVASQPWPFPHSLMIGFTAEFAGGVIRVDKTELEDARWFSAEKMPELLPSSMSISRTLIEAFLADSAR